MSVFHTIASKDLWSGDHIYIWRIGVYQHHGIVLFVNKEDPNESRVLEFNTEDGSHKPWRARIQEVSLRQFRGTSKLRRVAYNSGYAWCKLAGTAYRQESLPPEHVVDNAQLLLEQIRFGGGLPTPNDATGAEATYHLLLRNCECLAHWCKTGRWLSEQVEKMIHWVGTGLGALLKTLGLYLVNQASPLIAQELLSEAIEVAVPSIANKCCNLLCKEMLGNAIALIILEFLKVIWRLYQVRHGQLNWKEFAEQTIRSLINGLMAGVFAFAIQAFLLAISGGAAAPVAIFIGGLFGAILGPLVGNYLSQKALDIWYSTGNNPLQNDDTETTH